MRSGIGGEFPVAYRLARRNGELVLQGLWRETSSVYDYSAGVFRTTRSDEWRDIPTAEESGDAGG